MRAVALAGSLGAPAPLAKARSCQSSVISPRSQHKSIRTAQPIACMAQATPADVNQGTKTGMRYALAIHGGAGVINSTNKVWIDSAMNGLQKALDAGHAILKAGGSAMDAAVAAVVVLENDPHFNAGVGSVLTASGHHELEASVMSSDQQCGAVTLIKHVTNPIILARQVMDHTPHIFLSGQQAEQFAVRQGHTLVDNSTFTTQQRKEQWQKYKDEEKLAAHDEIVQNVQNLDVTQHTQTVGAVAIDREGRLAAATSTGGRTNKWDGRIGDTPMIGAGTWADSRCAVSGTGVGEEFIRRAAAHDVAARVQYKGISLQQAMKEVVWESFSEGDGGFVGLDADYNVVMDFNSVGMYRGAVDYRGLNVTAVFQDQWADGVAV